LGSHSLTHCHGRRSFPTQGRQAAGSNSRKLHAASYTPPAAAALSGIIKSCNIGFEELETNEKELKQLQHGQRIKDVRSEHGVPFDAAPLITGLKIASMAYAECVMLASLQEVQKQQQLRDDTEAQQQRRNAAAAAAGKKQVFQESLKQYGAAQQTALSDALVFVDRVQGFVGGLSVQAAAVFEQLRGVLQQVQEAAAAAAAAGSCDRCSSEDGWRWCAVAAEHCAAAGAGGSSSSAREEVT
jgi:hypothetical protein